MVINFVVEVNESWLLGRAIYKSLEQERRLENPFERVCEFVWFHTLLFFGSLRKEEWKVEIRERKKNCSQSGYTSRNTGLIVRSKWRIINHDTTKIQICPFLDI